MVVASGLRALDRADTIVVPGWLPINREPTTAVLRALDRAHRRGARLVSICSGAFVLAATGLLDGRRVPPIGGTADDLQRRFPAVQVDPDVLYIDHGDIATSAGSGTGIDLCLQLVRNDHGAAYAAQVARRMVMPPHREGGQVQYRDRGSAVHPIPRRRARLGNGPPRRPDHRRRPGGAAQRLTTHARPPLRRATRQAPGQWLLAQRIARTRVLLEETELAVETIAVRVGLSSATNLRRRFRAALRTTPSAYRRAFQEAGQLGRR